VSADALAVAVAAVIVGAVLGAALVYALIVSMRKNTEADAAQAREALKGQFAAVSADVVKGATEQFLELAKTRLETENVKAASAFEEQRRAVEGVVTGLQDRLKDYEKLVRGFESDRTEKYGSLEEQLRKTVSSTEALQQTTDKLRSVLSDSRTRGQWGERMAEDILRKAGLLEDVQYRRNRAQEGSSSRPDFTFLLPGGQTFNMDVKFPLDNYLRMCEAAEEQERRRHKDAFLKDVKARIKEITKRDYIDPEGRTLDYVVLFIPNEQVYAFVQSELPDLIDDSLSKKVLLTSPFTLYAVIAIVRQAHENFHFSQATREIVRSIGSFRQAFEKFKSRFEKLGDQLDKAQSAYADIAGPSYKMLDQAVARIEKLDDGEDDGPKDQGRKDASKAVTE